MRNVRAAQIVVVAVLVLSGAYLAACKADLPAAPSELTGGIVIYEHANFLGESAHISVSVRDLKDFDGPCRHDEFNFDDFTSSTTWDWDDCMSSIRVAPGWQGVIYRDSNYHGQSLAFTADVPNLALEMGTCDQGMNDCVTSIRVFGP